MNNPSVKKSRFIVHLFPQSKSERKLISFLESASQEQIRKILSKGQWLTEILIASDKSTVLSDFSGDVPLGDDTEHKVFYIRFTDSIKPSVNDPINTVFNNLNSYRSFTGRLVYLRSLLFRGFFVYNATSGSDLKKFLDIFGSVENDKAKAENLVKNSVDKNQSLDTLHEKKKIARSALGGLM